MFQACNLLRTRICDLNWKALSKVPKSLARLLSPQQYSDKLRWKIQLSDRVLAQYAQGPEPIPKHWNKQKQKKASLKEGKQEEKREEGGEARRKGKFSLSMEMAQVPLNLASNRAAFSVSVCLPWPWWFSYWNDSHLSLEVLWSFLKLYIGTKGWKAERVVEWSSSNPTTRSCSGRHPEEGGRHVSLLTTGNQAIGLITLQSGLLFVTYIFYLKWKVLDSSMRNWLLQKPGRSRRWSHLDLGTTGLRIGEFFCLNC